MFIALDAYYIAEPRRGDMYMSLLRSLLLNGQPRAINMPPLTGFVLHLPERAAEEYDTIIVLKLKQQRSR